MAMFLARGAGYLANRLAPALLRRGAMSYARNPAVWQRAAGVGSRLVRASAAAGAVAYAGRKRKSNAPQVISNKRRTYGNNVQTQASGGGRATYSGSSGYAGKFNRRTKRRRRRYKKKVKRVMTLSQIKSKGIYSTFEGIGQVNDPDCVYIGYMAYSPDNMLENLSIALVKCLFAKAGTKITNMNDIIPAISATANDIAVYIMQDDQAVYAAQSFSSGASTYGSIALWMKSQLLIVAREDNANAAINVLNIKSIKLFMPVIDGVLTPQAVIHIDDMTVHVASYNQLKIQNRSASADSSESTDVVSNNPLCGKVYDFSTQPRTIVDGLGDLMEFTSLSGQLLLRAAQFTAAGVVSEMKEPPSGRIFCNTTKTDKVYLQPGQIKETTMYYSKQSPLIKFLKGLPLRRSGDGTKITFTNCPTQIVALEDVINFNESNKITCAYELNRQEGIYLTEKKKAVTIGGYYTSTLSNVTA